MRFKQPIVGSASLLLLTLSAGAQEPPTTTLDTVTVTAAAESTIPYVAPVAATTGMKTDTPLLETPNAVSVVSEAIIKDQDAQDLEDVLRNVAGVSTGGTYEGWDYFRIRGFDAAFNAFWDGLRGDFGLSPELYGVERVEIIKGPASTLYGQIPLGGLVNVVSKHPKLEREFSGEVGFTGGTWNNYEGRFDINIPLLVPQQSTTTPVSAKGAKSVTPVTTTESGLGIYARVVGLYNNNESHVDYIETERIFIAPSLTFAFSEDTTLTILSEYKRDSGKFAMPLPALGTVLNNPNGEIPTNRYLGLPNSNDLVQERYKIGYELKHRFNETVALRQNLAYSYLEQRWTDIFYTSSLLPDNRTVLMYPYDYWNDIHRFAVDTALDFTFETGPVKHTLTAGVDYFRSEDSYWSRQIDYANPAGYLAIDAFKPNYNQSKPAYSTYDYGGTELQMLGLYLQEHAKIGDVTLTLGGRYDKFWRDDSYMGTDTSYDQDALTPKVGLTYEFVPGFAAYANYGRSFTPQWSARNNGGTPVDPEEGVNWEGGLKYNTLGGKLTGMISVFQLTRENVATPDPTTPDPADFTVSGEQRSRGVEFETAAELMPGLTFTAAYTYIDAEVTEDNDIPVGTPLMGVPDHAINAWLKYTVQDGPLKGFGVGVGGRYYTEQSGDTYNSFNLPSYGLIDAALYYERDQFSVQVNFNNIADKRHFTGSYDSLYVLPGEPFNVSASVTWKF